jgi:hypothetical protein
MLTELERALLGEVLVSKFPGIQPNQAEASIREAETVVTQAVNNVAATQPSSTPVMAGYSPVNTYVGNATLPTVSPNGNPEWGISLGGGGGYNLGPINFGVNGNIGIRGESWLSDTWDRNKKGVCKTAATAAYSAAMAALTGLNPVAAAAGQVVATAAYHKALEQC